MLPEKLAFLTSTRFWALVLIAILKVLATDKIIDPTTASAIETLLLGFTVVRTIDRGTEYIGNKV